MRLDNGDHVTFQVDLNINDRPILHLDLVLTQAVIDSCKRRVPSRPPSIPDLPRLLIDLSSEATALRSCDEIKEIVTMAKTVEILNNQ